MGVLIREDRVRVISFTYNPASIAAATTAEEDVTIKGLKVGDFVAVNKPSLTAGVGIVNARVKAANTLSITWVNATASPVDPGSETYTLFVYRAERTMTEMLS